MRSNGSLCVENANEMKVDNKNERSIFESLDGTLDPRMMKAESHRLEKLFHQIDTNRDGRIDAHELSEGLKRMGYCHISEEQVEVCDKRQKISDTEINCSHESPAQNVFVEG